MFRVNPFKILILHARQWTSHNFLNFGIVTPLKNWMLILVLLCENERQRWDAPRYIKARSDWIGWFVDCGFTSNSAIFQLYSDRTVVQCPNLDLLPATKGHGQLGVFSLQSLPWHRHWFKDVFNLLAIRGHNWLNALCNFFSALFVTL